MFEIYHQHFLFAIAYCTLLDTQVPTVTVWGAFANCKYSHLLVTKYMLSIRSISRCAGFRIVWTQQGYTKYYHWQYEIWSLDALSFFLQHLRSMNFDQLYHTHTLKIGDFECLIANDLIIYFQKLDSFWTSTRHYIFKKLHFLVFQSSVKSTLNSGNSSCGNGSFGSRSDRQTLNRLLEF